MKLNGILSLTLLCVLAAGCENDCVKSERCSLQPQTDPCYAAISRYYFDKDENKCKKYTWGGCTEYPFETMEECQECECN
jgi:hypothetical protein